MLERLQDGRASEKEREGCPNPTLKEESQRAQERAKQGHYR